MLDKKYKAQVSRREGKIILRSLATDVAKQLQDLQSPEARDVVLQLSVSRLDIPRPAIDTARSTRVFMLRGTLTVVKDPTNKAYKAGDIEPVSIVYVKPGI